MATLAPERSVVLTGMMGTGKTAVGREIARRLGRPFVDLDGQIEAAAGMPVAEIFARHGEADFRAREHEAVLGLAGTGGAVIATGGWTVGDPADRAALAALGPIVCLGGHPEALADRLAGAGATERPVLGEATAEAIEGLLAVRRAVYDALPLQVDTTGRDVGQVADQVLALAGALGEASLEAVPVAAPGGGYSAVVGAGLLDGLGPLLAARGLAGPTVIVTDGPAGGRYGERVAAGLRAAGIDVETVEMGVGERAKTLETVGSLYGAFAARGLGRDGQVLALGGGVVGDTAGFAAATYLRGVPLVVVPTTLLAMVDASIGGKTAVNLPAGKNLAGVVAAPAVVAADPTALASLPPEVLRGGLAEVVKAGLIANPALLMALEGEGPPGAGDAGAWAGLIRQALAVKATIVSEDPIEHGIRERLNLGHTFAHALEVATDYRLSHGDAVAVGLVAAGRLAVAVGLAEAPLAERIERLVEGLGLPTRYAGADPEAVLAAMAADKKRRAGRLRFVLPREAGDVEVVDDVPEDAVRATLAALRA